MNQNDRIIARLTVLEVISVFSLALYLARAGNDPDRSKVKAFLDAIQTDGERSLTVLSPEMQQEGADVLRDLLNRANEMAFAFQPKGPQSH